MILTCVKNYVTMQITRFFVLEISKEKKNII